MKKYLSLGLVLVLGLVIFPVGVVRAEGCEQARNDLAGVLADVNLLQPELERGLNFMANASSPEELRYFASVVQSISDQLMVDSRHANELQSFLDQNCSPLPD